MSASTSTARCFFSASCDRRFAHPGAGREHAGATRRAAFTVQLGSVVTAAGFFPSQHGVRSDCPPLTKGDPSTNTVTASFQYFDGGVGGPVTTFNASAGLFHGENWTQGQFFFGQDIAPEPSTFALLGFGLAPLEEHVGGIGPVAEAATSSMTRTWGGYRPAGCGDGGPCAWRTRGRR